MYILEKIGNPLQDVFHGTVFPQVDLLTLEDFNKALDMGIGITPSAHADLKVVQFEFFDILTRGVLDTTV
jgi:hypothetical protein